MRPTSEQPARKPIRVAAIALIVALPGLAACASSSGDTGGAGGIAGFFSGGAPSSSNISYPPDYFIDKGYCPPVQIRAGTEAMVTYERGKDLDPAAIRYQGSISRTARECRTVGGVLTIKVGVAGRIVAGPKGGPGNVQLPVRIALVKQSTNAVLFSQVFKIDQALVPPDFGADFSIVADQVTAQIAPDDRDLIVYVGFDEGKPKTRPADTVAY